MNSQDHEKMLVLNYPSQETKPKDMIHDSEPQRKQANRVVELLQRLAQHVKGCKSLCGSPSHTKQFAYHNISTNGPPDPLSNVISLHRTSSSTDVDLRDSIMPSISREHHRQVQKTSSITDRRIIASASRISISSACSNANRY